MSLAREARRHLRAHSSGVLSTLSRALDGYPYGSVVPYALDAEACPVLLASRLAEHTKNFLSDPRASLLVHDPGADVQAEARVTLLGRVVPLARAGAAPSRYLRYHPRARDYLGLDFDFYRIEPVTLRVVAGFGKVHWISREAYAPQGAALAAREDDILAHMNSDHAQTLREYCRFHHGRDATDAVMVGVDCDGFDVRAGDGLLRFDFERTVTDADAARAELVKMARKARAS